ICDFCELPARPSPRRTAAPAIPLTISRKLLQSAFPVFKKTRSAEAPLQHFRFTRFSRNHHHTLGLAIPLSFVPLSFVKCCSLPVIHLSPAIPAEVPQSPDLPGEAAEDH